MSTELSNGVIIPEEYSDDWYDEMSINLRKLNDVITAASDNATDIQRLDTDKANQSDLTALTSRVSQNETDIIALQTAVSGALKREIVQSLPTEDISTTTIYMIRNSQSSGTNIYDEYMYINSQWELIGTSATDFSNYYTKTESDNLLSAKANQTDLTSLSGRVTQNETDITALQTAVSGALKREIVQTLPTEDISTTTIYMIRNSQSSGTNIYDEYMYINSQWELIGTSATDFSNYYTKTEIDTLLSYKATDSDVVHKSGNETKSGELTLSDTLNSSNIVPRSNNTYDFGSVSNLLRNLYTYHGYFQGQQQGDEYSGNVRTNLTLTSNRDTLGKSGCVVDTYRENKIQGTGSHILGFGIKENSVRYEGCRFSWFYDDNNSGYVFALRPTTQGTNRPIKYELGTSSSKWSTINGLNPSSLGMPDLSNGIDISSYITNFGAGTVNEYTPVADGWISIANSGDSPIFIRVYNDYGFEQVVYSERNEVGGTTGGTYTRFGSLMIPCINNIKIYIIVSPSTSVLVSAKFYPCKGTV